MFAHQKRSCSVEFSSCIFLGWGMKFNFHLMNYSIGENRWKTTKCTWNSVENWASYYVHGMNLWVTKHNGSRFARKVVVVVVT